MSRKMLINATHAEENRVAIVKDGILTELDIEVFGREQTKGNIYKAAVVRVEPGLQAAFVDYGAGRLGFLQMGELHPCFFKAADPDGSRKGKLRINDLLRRGQEILVQVTKGERGTKGAALTTHLSLAGRYMVLMPDSDSRGVSRKIEEDSVRKKLKKTMDSLDLPENMGYIVRTAGIDQSNEELRRDFDYLVRVYENILALGKKVKAPALIYKESNLVIRSIRDYFTPDIDEVLVDDPKVMQEAKEFFQQVMPECVKLVKLHTEKRPIFSRYQIEEQIETIHRNKVPLPSGGSIVIDRTEALVAIDVNSGKMAGEQGVEATAYKTNLEAADEAARQLRLRDLGGLIVIDFIDMRDRKHAREVEKRLKEALKYDKAKVTIGKISSFGLLEMTRQRIKDALAEGTFLTCPHCDGSGRIKSPEAQAVAALRKIQAAVAKGHVGRVEAEVPHEVATYLLNARRAELLDMEQRHQLAVIVRGRGDLFAGQVEIAVHKREQGDELYLPPVTAQLDAAEAQAIAEEARAAVARAETAKAEAKARAAAEKAVAATAAEETADETNEAGKKKRKRKRKKKSAADGEAVEISAPIGPAGSPVEAREEDELGDSEVDGDVERDDALVVEGSEGSRKKRKRRRKKKKAADAPDAPGTPAAEALVTPPADESGEIATATKKKRKRRRKKKGGTGDIAPAPAVAESAGEPAALPAPAAGAAAPAKRTRRKPAATEAPVAVNADTDAVSAPPAKPRRPRKTAATGDAAVETESAVKPAKTKARKVASGTAAETASDAPPPAAAKSGRTRKAKQAEPPAESSPVAAEPAAKKRSRRSKPV